MTGNHNPSTGLGITTPAPQCSGKPLWQLLRQSTTMLRHLLRQHNNDWESQPQHRTGNHNPSTIWIHPPARPCGNCIGSLRSPCGNDWESQPQHRTGNHNPSTIWIHPPARPLWQLHRQPPKPLWQLHRQPPKPLWQLIRQNMLRHLDPPPARPCGNCIGSLRSPCGNCIGSLRSRIRISCYPADGPLLHPTPSRRIQRGCLMSHDQQWNLLPCHYLKP
jgi:hypothetical protein